MFVFVDDSGDCGFKLGQGSSQHIVLSACVFKSAREVEHAWKTVNQGRFLSAGPTKSQILKTEYKYAKTKLVHKDAFFNQIVGEEFAIRTICADKSLLYSSHLREHPNDLKAYLLKQLLTHTYGTVANAKLIVDGNDNRSFGVTDREYFLEGVNRSCPGTLTDVEFVDSKKNEIIQIADMVAGSTRKRLEGDAAASKHFETYKNRLAQPKGSYWCFK